MIVLYRISVRTHQIRLQMKSFKAYLRHQAEEITLLNKDLRKVGQNYLT
jgi:hypothetical protein